MTAKIKHVSTLFQFDVYSDDGRTRYNVQAIGKHRETWFAIRKEVDGSLLANVVSPYGYSSKTNARSALIHALESKDKEKRDEPRLD